jgi:3-oxoacyl-[acyl-carrier protein] reductase
LWILKERGGGGSILNIASVVGIKGFPNQGAYTASKHAMVGLTKVIAEEGREFGVRAHVICPGGVATEMAKQARPDLDVDILIQPADIAETVLYLLNLPAKISVDLIHVRRFGSGAF